MAVVKAGDDAHWRSTMARLGNGEETLAQWDKLNEFTEPLQVRPRVCTWHTLTHVCRSRGLTIVCAHHHVCRCSARLYASTLSPRPNGSDSLAYHATRALNAPYLATCASSGGSTK